jgi:enediyne biosynthesis protein E4
VIDAGKGTGADHGRAGRTVRRPGYRSRARRLLYVAVAFLAAAIGAIAVLRVRARPYTPGAERDSSDEITRRLDRDLPGDAPEVRFTDAAAVAGIDFVHFQGRRSTQLPEDMGSGLAWGDYDGDGDPDLFLVNMAGPLPEGPAAPGGSPARSALYRNEGDGTFTDVTGTAGTGAGGHGMGAAWGDADGDGDLDLFVTRYGTNLLFRNRGDGTFAECADEAGLGGVEGFWSGASWADFDGDGDLDLYVCGYVRYRYDAALAGRASLQYQASVPYTLNPSTYEPERNLLYRNDGGRFREIGRPAGVDNPTGRSLSAAWADFDGDGRLDLYVANDVSDNAMYLNRGNGTFRDISHAAYVADYRGAMGLAIGDWENDGDLDIFITHWMAQENGFYVNRRESMPSTPMTPMRFLDEADQHGLGQISLDYIGWGTGFFDFDNDGRLDLYAVNGSTFQKEDDPSLLVPMRNQLFWNAGPERGYFEVGTAAGPAWTGEFVGRGAAVADYDGDGDEDLAVAVNGGRTRLLRNDGDGGGFLRVVLRGPVRAGLGAGSGPARRAGRPVRARTPTFAEGAVVRVTTGGVTQMRPVGTGGSYLSQSPPGEVRFGLGDATTVDRMAIAWPDGRTEEIAAVPANAVVTLVEGEPPAIRRGGPVDREAVRRFWRTFQEGTARRMRRDRAGDRSGARGLALLPRAGPGRSGEAGRGARSVPAPGDGQSAERPRASRARRAARRSRVGRRDRSGGRRGTPAPGPRDQRRGDRPARPAGRGADRAWRPGGGEALARGRRAHQPEEHRGAVPRGLSLLGIGRPRAGGRRLGPGDRGGEGGGADQGGAQRRGPQGGAAARIAAGEDALRRIRHATAVGLRRGRERPRRRLRPGARPCAGARTAAPGRPLTRWADMPHLTGTLRAGVRGATMPPRRGAGRPARQETFREDPLPAARPPRAARQHQEMGPGARPRLHPRVAGRR